MSRKGIRRAVGVAVVGVALLAAPGSTQAGYRPGFVETNLTPAGSPAQGGLESFDFEPDGTIWLAQSGQGEGMHVWVLRDGELTPVHSFPWLPIGDRGIHSIAVDPDFDANQRLWLYYTWQGGPVHNRLSHFTVVNDTLQDEQVIWEGPVIETTSEHNGGCLALAPDGTIYLGVGDYVLQASNVPQDPTSPIGKILRMNPDGSAPSDNPFVGDEGTDPLIWSIGHRQPFRCRLHPETSSLFLSEVGTTGIEELNVVLGGANYGWPLIEGAEAILAPGFNYSVWEYDHMGVGACIIGGDFAEPGDLHPDYEGDYFFGDWARGEMYRMVLDEQQKPTLVETWATNLGRPAEFKFGPDGALYYARRGPGSGMMRVEFVGAPNLQPVAVGAASPASGPSPLDVTLDGSASSDPDDDTLVHTWDLGDGDVGEGAVVNHTYAPGVYEALLTVDDGNGLTDVSSIRVVSGNSPPTVTLAQPAPGTSFDAGQLVTFDASASDLEDGALACQPFTWQVTLHYDGLSKLFSGPQKASCGGSFTTADTGITSTDVFYRVLISARDSGAPLGDDARLTHEAYVDIVPNISTLTLASEPRPDLTLTLDGNPVEAPASAASVVGFRRPVGVVDSQLADDGHTYTWRSWSDGGELEHEWVTPAGDSTLTATFGCDVLVEVENLQVAEEAAGGNLLLSWSPVEDDCLNEGPVRYRVYSAPTPRPVTDPGLFPLDPGYELVGASGGSSFSHAPPAGDEYFLVVAVGSDQLDGAVGHYGE